MFEFQKRLSKIRILKYFSSVKITVVCLTLLFILTFWGTIYQVENGLFLAQEVFFHSWFFPVFGFFPFPGAQLVMWVMFINLLCMCLTRLVFRWSNAGIVIIHLGLLLFLISGFVTFIVTKETHLNLREGMGSNLSSSYHDWEISAWETRQQSRRVYAYDVDASDVGNVFAFDELGIELTLDSYFPNADAFMIPGSNQMRMRNASGIQSLQEKSVDIEPEQNLPGLTASIIFDGNKEAILLYGAEIQPTTINTIDKTINLQLRRKRSVLPFTLILKDFMMEVHPNTQTARSFKSLVEILTPGTKREKLISMNQPLRYKDFTLYQASYAIDEMGREYSTLAVVENSGRWLPYIASFITFIGLAWHFLLMAFQSKKRSKK